MSGSAGRGARPASRCGTVAGVSSEPDIDQTQHEIVDQREEVRDPADDSGEADDPTAVVDAYPKAFDDRIEEAEAAISQDETAGGRARSDGPLPN